VHGLLEEPRERLLAGVSARETLGAMTARLADAELRAMMRDARAALAEDLAGLTQDQWHQQSLCGEWDVEHVVAHLTAGASTGQWAWIRSIVAAGFRPAVHNARRLREHLGATPAQTLE